ncbi:response regulator [Fimbriimonas ginsengisoli]|uniref:response regulator n=1 Tax=Fimbriimonas ginsengisoli TaxID=1005039 RepID=UPI001D0F2503|nr:response regulator [Fimbriimonas ginsengisoli]
MNGLRRSLLLVEDSPDDVFLSVRGIAASGVPCDVNLLEPGGEALSLLLEREGPTPDLIVLDFHLPGQNGLEILRALRKQEKTKLIPIVILSDLQSEKDVKECLSGGANSCVQKASDPAVYADNIGLIVRYWLTVHRTPDSPVAAQP